MLTIRRLPRFETVARVCRALGLKLEVRAA
jgi:DNA-binding phage protein